MLILGLDPGSRITGYGLVKRKDGKTQYIASGCIRMPNADFATRLVKLYDATTQIIADFEPDYFAIEQVFVKHNVQSALKLGQARGVLLLAAARTNKEIFEYSAREVKLAISGYGNAQKHQVQAMVKSILSLNAVPQEDAADALAIAICHINMSKLNKITKTALYDLQS
jgi:crossover junction endodeoxyribonuclease RuvC